MEMMSFIYGVIVTLLLVLVINSCSGSAMETFVDINKKDVTQEQLLTILGNGYWYMHDLMDSHVPSTDPDPLQPKINSARYALYNLAMKFKVDPSKTPYYNMAISGDLNQDELSTNISTPASHDAFMKYRQNRVLPKNSVFVSPTVLALYTVVFDALFNKYITINELSLLDLSIDEINVSGLPY